mmetsp:Transcript_17872/g.26477  ORF Transcript_17872/g.26477 Transcript_17872/m.26477 type:complete len:341 (+) Transcript_17872:809-1831(+)
MAALLCKILLSRKADALAFFSRGESDVKFVEDRLRELPKPDKEDAGASFDVEAPPVFFRSTSTFVARATTLKTTSRACSTIDSRKAPVSSLTSTLTKPAAEPLAKFPEIVPGAVNGTTSVFPFKDTSRTASSNNGRITSASLGCNRAASGRLSVLNVVDTDLSSILDESMFKSRERLAFSPVVKECRNKSNVHARIRELTRELKEAEIFLEMAEGAYTRVLFVHIVKVCKLCEARCSKSDASADASAAPAEFNTDAAMAGTLFPAAVFLLCSPTFGSAFLAVSSSFIDVFKSRPGSEHMISVPFTVLLKHSSNSFSVADFSSLSLFFDPSKLAKFDTIIS